MPIWEGTRPYAAIPIQWSCHIEEEGGELRHEEFLDLSGEPPMRALAEKMLGSWSIKAVLPAMVPEMSYAGLEAMVAIVRFFT